jgi:hypothetical protein
MIALAEQDVLPVPPDRLADRSVAPSSDRAAAAPAERQILEPEHLLDRRVELRKMHWGQDTRGADGTRLFQTTPPRGREGGQVSGRTRRFQKR